MNITKGSLLFSVLVVAVVGSQMLDSNITREHDSVKLTCDVTKTAPYTGISSVIDMVVSRKPSNENNFEQLYNYSKALANSATESVIAGFKGRLKVTAEGINTFSSTQPSSTRVVLSIDNVQCDDSGIYKCEHQSDYGGTTKFKSTEQNVSISVGRVETITGIIYPDTLLFMEESILMFVCQVDGPPDVNILWRYQPCSTNQMLNFPDTAETTNFTNGTVESRGCIATRFSSELLKVHLKTNSRKICMIQCVAVNQRKPDVQLGQWNRTIIYIDGAVTAIKWMFYMLAAFFAVCVCGCCGCIILIIRGTLKLF